MDSETMRKEMLRFYDAFNRRDLDSVSDVVADDFVDHEIPDGMPSGFEGVRQFLGAFVAAFPDMKFEPLEIIATNNNVAARLRTTGTHEGEFFGIPATGRKIDVESADWVRYNDEGKVVEHWGYTDNLKLMQQLGVMPEDPTGG